MMNYIGANGQFINLAAVVLIEDVSEEKTPIARLTTIAGAEIDLDGEDAERLFQQIEIISAETMTATARMWTAVQQLEQAAEAAKGAQK